MLLIQKLQDISMGQNFEVKTDTFAQENQRWYK